MLSGIQKVSQKALMQNAFWDTFCKSLHTVFPLINAPELQNLQNFDKIWQNVNEDAMYDHFLDIFTTIGHLKLTYYVVL